jgi:group I intron endonuclease
MNNICGIYMMSFNDYNLIYIGQSIDIHKRFSRHLSDLRANRHYNNKITEAFKTFGPPTLDILEVCCSNNLDELENYYIKEFDSCINGLNIRNEEESILRGPLANSAKYTEAQILKIFELLCNPDNSSKYISEITGVPSGNINSIARGASHSWLSERFPDKYAYMISLKGTRNGRQNSLLNRNGKYHPELLSPTGEIYSEIDNLAEFCRTHNLPYCNMNKLVRGKKKSCGGWSVFKE